MSIDACSKFITSNLCNKQSYCVLALYVYTAVGNIKLRQSPGSPFSGLLVMHHHAATAKYKGLLRSEWGAVAGL